MNLHLLFGRVSETGTDGRVKVEFPSHDIVSHFIPVLFQKAKGDFEIWPLDVNTCVACLMDRYCEDGVVLGAIYTDNDTPPEGVDKDKWLRVYDDGSKEYYDRAASERYFKVGTSVISIKDGLIEFNGGDLDGLPKVGALVTKITQLENQINSILSVLKTHTHPVAVTGSSTAQTGSASASSSFVSITAISPITQQSDIENTKIKQ